MYKIAIRPDWVLRTPAGQALPPRLVELLVAIRAAGTLAAACRQRGLSYRYAWGLLREGERVLGAPLLRSTRGRGAQLTALGERLVWADSRITARLSPLLDSLAAELEAEFERGLSGQAAPLRLQASHGFGVETLRRAMAAADVPLDLQYRSPDEALDALRAGTCDLAGLHVPIGGLEGELLRHYRDRLDPEGDRVIELAMRRQGLVVAPGNPKGLQALVDLTREGVRFIHRQPGSGTRLLLEALLARDGIAPSAIDARDVEEPTHAAVAACVASGLADAGFALEPPARLYGLDYVPLATERYFFVCRRDTIEAGRLAGLLRTMEDPGFRRELDRLPGYDGTFCGRVLTLPQAFASLRDDG